MKKKLVIFGIGKIAEVVYYYASSECKFEVVAFCADSEFVKIETFNGLPVVSFQNVENDISSF